MTERTGTNPRLLSSPATAPRIQIPNFEDALREILSFDPGAGKVTGRRQGNPAGGGAMAGGEAIGRRRLATNLCHFQYGGITSMLLMLVYLTFMMFLLPCANYINQHTIAFRHFSQKCCFVSSIDWYLLENGSSRC